MSVKIKLLILSTLPLPLANFKDHINIMSMMWECKTETKTILGKQDETYVTDKVYCQR